MKKVDLLLEDGLVLTLDKDSQILCHKTLVIDKGLIIDILDHNLVREQYIAERTLDCKEQIIMPGLVNSHTHVPMSFFRGLADDLPLQDWLQNHIWPAEKKFLSEEFVYDAALYGIAELLKNGITCFCDMYFYGHSTALAAQKAGIRAIIGEGVLDFPMALHQNRDDMINYALEGQARYKTNDLIEFSISPHSIYVCGMETLKKCAEVAERENMLMQIHLTETSWEVQDCLTKNRKTPVRYLYDMGFLSERVLASHGVWIDQEEFALLQEKQVNIVINTESNLKLASGFAPLKEYYNHSINICLGTDGVASNNDLDLFSEMNITAKVHKTLNNDPTFPNARQMVEAVTSNAYKAIRKKDELGSVEVGKIADLITLDINEIQALPMYDIYSHLVYCLKGNNVHNVVVQGKIIVENKKILTLDETELKEKALYYSKKIKNG